MDELEIITPEIVQTIGNRKHEGILSVIVDTKTNKTYLIPHTKEHIDSACEILGTTKKQIENRPELAQHLIPINILFEEGELIGVINGESGMEMGYKINHPREANDKAQTLIWTLITKSEEKGKITLGKIKINKIIYSK